MCADATATVPCSGLSAESWLRSVSLCPRPRSMGSPRGSLAMRCRSNRLIARFTRSEVDEGRAAAERVAQERADV